MSEELVEYPLDKMVQLFLINIVSYYIFIYQNTTKLHNTKNTAKCETQSVGEEEFNTKLKFKNLKR